MKKILLSLITMLSLTANAGTTVPIVWPFSISSNQANFIRLIIEEANKQQDKYTFIFENKPGAGGTLAAQYVLNYNGIAIISSSSSFFVRPQFYPYPKESHRVEDFRPVMVECVNQPYGIISTKYKSFDELRKQERVTIGANYGSLTEAMARELQRALPNTQVDIIPFASGTLQPTQEVIAGRVDLNVDLPAELMQWIESGKVNVIGSSGTVDHPNFKTFHGQGVKGFEDLTSSYAMYTKADTDPAVVEELHKILRAAALASKDLPRLYARDYCTTANYTLKQSNDSFAKWSKLWPEKLAKLKK